MFDFWRSVRNGILILVFQCSFGLYLLGQDSLVYTHRSIEFIDAKIHFAEKQLQDTTVSLSLISPMMYMHSAHTQSNGPDLLSTILVRGMGSRHTAVLWNGWNLQSPVNGVLDLSLLTDNSQNVHLNKSSGSSIVGNASAAGALILTPSYVEQGSSATLSSWFNSYGNQDLSIGVANKQDKLLIQANYHRIEHNNNYDYDFFGDKKNQKEASKQGNDFSVNTRWNINNHHQVKTSVWLQNSDRLIPSTKTNVYNNESQKDKNIRAHIEWTLQQDDRQISVRSAFLQEQIDYRSAVVLKSLSISKTYLSEIVMKETYGKMNWASGMQLKKVDANLQSLSFDSSNSFSNDLVREQASIWLSANYPIRNWWNVDLGTRLDVIDHLSNKIFNYHASTNIKLANGILNYKINSVFQLPTLNDLYWPLSGNPNLQNETGIAQELSYSKSITRSDTKWNVQTGLFGYIADNWIIWSPNLQGNWTPENRRDVWSRGVELEIDFSTKIYKYFSLHSHLQYAYTRASIEKDINKNIKGKQLIYIPKNKISWLNSMEYKRWGVNFESIYVGKRYDDNANNNLLNAYIISNIELTKYFQISKKYLYLSLKIDNLFDTNYELVRYFPVSLRSVTFALNLKL